MQMTSSFLERSTCPEIRLASWKYWWASEHDKNLSCCLQSFSTCGETSICQCFRHKQNSLCGIWYCNGVEETKFGMFLLRMSICWQMWKLIDCWRLGTYPFQILFITIFYSKLNHITWIWLHHNKLLTTHEKGSKLM